MIIRLKIFNDSLNIAVIVDSGGEYASVKYAQFSLTFTEWD